MNKLIAKLLALFFIVMTIDISLNYILLNGLNKYYGLDKDADILFIGNSTTIYGIDSQKVEEKLKRPVAKYAIPASNVYERHNMIKYFFSQRKNSPKVVVYGVNNETFNGVRLGSNSYRLFYPYIDNKEVGDFVKSKSGSWEEYTSRVLLRLLRYNNTLLLSSFRGLLNYMRNVKTGMIDIDGFIKYLEHSDKSKISIIEPRAVECFEESISFIRSHNAKVILLYIPTIDLLNNANITNYSRVIREYNRITEKYNCIFLNYNNRYEHRYDLFYDYMNHLNKDGQGMVTDDLIQDLKGTL